ncbi:hypothetical protein GCM10022281_17250 [Sphingomonas rosea]|uniref:Uncharacterized protein n=1 Tax=Sphingomonas rosea TaxID=335605 RepID=A0ABP7U719_9SPHN
MDDFAPPSRLTRARGAALLLALLYGLFGGSFFNPLPAQARAQAIALTLDGHPGIAIAAKSGKSFLKAPRPTPGPLLLPTAAAPVTARLFRPLGASTTRTAAPRAGAVFLPYRARAPPTV